MRVHRAELWNGNNLSLYILLPRIVRYHSTIRGLNCIEYVPKISDTDASNASTKFHTDFPATGFPFWTWPLRTDPSVFSVLRIPLMGASENY